MRTTLYTAILSVCLLTSCAGGMQRQACYAAADAKAWAEAERVCDLDNVPWYECADKNRINEGREQEYRACQ